MNHTCLCLCQPKLVLVYIPRRDGRLSRPWILITILIAWLIVDIYTPLIMALYVLCIALSTCIGLGYWAIFSNPAVQLFSCKYVTIKLSWVELKPWCGLDSHPGTSGISTSDRHHRRLGDDRVDVADDRRRSSSDAVHRGAQRGAPADVDARHQRASTHHRLSGHRTTVERLVLHTSRRRERRGRRILSRVRRTR